MAKAQGTNPSPLSLCIKLARENHRAGVLLERIVHWSRYGRAEIPVTSGYWIANDRAWWRREACLSADQYDRSIRRLKEWQLVETKQWWWAGRLILHVRPTELTTDYLAAAKTWKAADELIADVTTSHQQQVSENADQSSAKTLISNADSKFAKAGSATMLNPNNITNEHLNHKDKENEQCAPASPTCADVHAALNSKSGQEEISLKSLYEMWETTAKKFHAEAIAAGKFSGTLTAKEKGYIVQGYFRLGDFTTPYGEPIDFRSDALDIIAFYVSNTNCFYDESCSYTPAFLLYKDVGEVVNNWIEAGMPKHAGDLSGSVVN